MRVLTGGTFDLFHAGHVELLKKCRFLAGSSSDRANRVIVALNTDEFVEVYKGSRPIVGFLDRWRVLAACRYVDTVEANLQSATESFMSTIALTRPDLIVVGSDWRTKDYLAQLGVTQDWLDFRGIYIVYVPYTQGISSTDIKQRMLFS